MNNYLGQFSNLNIRDLNITMTRFSFASHFIKAYMIYMWLADILRTI